MSFFVSQPHRPQKLACVTKKEAEKGDAKMPLVPCILALDDEDGGCCESGSLWWNITRHNHLRLDVMYRKS